MSELEVASCFEFEKVLRGKSNKLFYPKSEVDAAIAELKAENERLKAKLEIVQATAYTESVDAGMENRKLKHALWLARAERAKEMCQRLLIQGFDPKWQEVERKCRAKAEEYK